MPKGPLQDATQAGFTIDGPWTLEPPLPAGQKVEDVLAFKGPITLTRPSAGTCAATVSGFHNAASLSIAVTEPGCDTARLRDEKFAAGFQGKTEGTWRPTGKRVVVTIAVAPP